MTSGCPPPSTDQRGVARPAGACDAGAYEANPTVGVGNVAAPEGTGGAASAVFPMTLSEASALAVTVAYTTQSGTAQPGADYVTTSGTLTFTPGVTALTVTVPLVTDAIDEDDESFALSLSNAVNAVASATPGVATIVDDDAPPQVSVTDCGEFEDSSGPGACLGSVSLSAASGKTVSVAFATQNGTATAPADYTAASGVLTFPPGTLQRPLSVPFVPDSVDEQDETFTIALTAPVNASLGDAQGIGTIFDDDGPVLSIAQPQVLEGNAGTTDATFAFSLSGPSVQSVLVSYATGDLTAMAGVDYQPRTGTLTFAPGSTQPILVPVSVIGDTADEPDERFALFIGVDNASTATPALTGTIRDDDRGSFPIEELAHGTERRRRPETDGTSLHVLSLPAFTSWEVVLDESSGDLSSGAAGPALERLSPNLVDVLQTSVPAGVGYARSLRLQNATSVAIETYAQGAQHGVHHRLRSRRRLPPARVRDHAAGAAVQRRRGAVDGARRPEPRDVGGVGGRALLARGRIPRGAAELHGPPARRVRAERGVGRRGRGDVGVGDDPARRPPRRPRRQGGLDRPRAGVRVRYAVRDADALGGQPAQRPQRVLAHQRIGVLREPLEHRPSRRVAAVAERDRDVAQQAAPLARA